MIEYLKQELKPKELKNHWNKRPKIKKLDQRVIDSYEAFIPQVYEAIRFVKMGSGEKVADSFDLLVRIIAEHERDMWHNLEKAIFPRIPMSGKGHCATPDTKLK